MLWLREVGTRAFACTHSTHVTGTVRRMFHMRQILCWSGSMWQFSARAEHTMHHWKSSSLSLLHDAQIQTCWFHATCGWEKMFSGTFCSHNISFLLETGMSHKENFAATCPHSCTQDIYWFISTVFCSGSTWQFAREERTVHYWKLRSFWPCFSTQEFKPVEFCEACCRDKILFGKFCPHNIIFSLETGMSCKENCRCNMRRSDELMCWQEQFKLKEKNVWSISNISCMTVTQWSCWLGSS